MRWKHKRRIPARENLLNFITVLIVMLVICGVAAVVTGVFDR